MWKSHNMYFRKLKRQAAKVRPHLNVPVAQRTIWWKTQPIDLIPQEQSMIVIVFDVEI